MGMSVEYTGVNKEMVAGKIKNFLESCPEDAVFKMVINSRRGTLKIKIKNARKGRIRKLFGRLKK
jgi:hypothetical protein